MCFFSLVLLVLVSSGDATVANLSIIGQALSQITIACLWFELIDFVRAMFIYALAILACARSLSPSSI